MTEASSTAQGNKSERFHDQRFKSGDSKDFEKVLHINRCAKVVKGGKRFHFSALVVVGSGKGELGFGLGKANEVSDAIRKALQIARKHMIKIKIKGTTIPHEVIGHYGAGRVMLKPAGEGTGIIAGAVVRALCEACGIKDILTKCLGSNNPINLLKATLDGFSSLRMFEEVERLKESRPEGGDGEVKAVTKTE